MALLEYKMKVRDYECDAQGIVNNANYQHYYEVSRHEFLEEHNLAFMDLHNNLGIDGVVTGIYIRFHHSLKGSEEFICTVDSLEKKGIQYIFNQSIYRLRDGKKCSSARVETALLVNGKISRPSLFDKVLGKYVGL